MRKGKVISIAQVLVLLILSVACNVSSEEQGGSVKDVFSGGDVDCQECEFKVIKLYALHAQVFSGVAAAEAVSSGDSRSVDERIADEIREAKESGQRQNYSPSERWIGFDFKDFRDYTKGTSLTIYDLKDMICYGIKTCSSDDYSEVRVELVALKDCKTNVPVPQSTPFTLGRVLAPTTKPELAAQDAHAITEDTLRHWGLALGLPVDSSTQVIEEHGGKAHNYEYYRAVNGNLDRLEINVDGVSYAYRDTDMHNETDLFKNSNSGKGFFGCSESQDDESNTLLDN